MHVMRERVCCCLPHFQIRHHAFRNDALRDHTTNLRITHRALINHCNRLSSADSEANLACLSHYRLSFETLACWRRLVHPNVQSRHRILHESSTALSYSTLSTMDDIAAAKEIIASIRRAKRLDDPGAGHNEAAEDLTNALRM